jgi:hypothetical protein
MLKNSFSLFQNSNIYQTSLLTSAAISKHTKHGFEFKRLAEVDAVSAQYRVPLVARLLQLEAEYPELRISAAKLQEREVDKIAAAVAIADDAVAEATRAQQALHR